ncbi:MAG: alginate lyase family protein [Candidatus Korobacteraceae bacterium]
MRSPKEISFRLRQEIANLVLSRTPPRLELRARAPLEGLPSPTAIADAVRGTPYADNLIKIADQMLQGRVPIFGTEIDYGDDIAWRRDPLRGTETPAKYFRSIPYLDLAIAGDHKWIWEINRHQHLVALAQAFVLTGNSAYIDEITRQLESWWEANPFQRGINWTSALEVGFRALSWIWIWHLVGERMSAEFRGRFLAELYRHGLHLEYNLSIYFSPNTHLLGEAVSLHAIGRLFPEFPRASKWRQLGREVLQAQMTAQVKPDGSHFEQSTYYHVYALDFFLLHAVLEDVPPEYRDGLARMTDFLAAVVDADGQLPFLGDDDGGRVFHPFGSRSGFARGTLATASRLLNKAALAHSASAVNEIAVWWLGPETSTTGVPSNVPQQSRTFSDSGLVVMRRSNVRVLFDAGPFGPWSAGHSHADSLSLVISVGEQEILIDPGTFTYLDREWRDLFRGTAAHNTIRLDDKDQATPAGPFRWLDKTEVSLLEFSSIPERDRAVGICRYRDFTHKRTVQLGDGRALEVVDEIDGPPGDHLLEQFWHVGLPVRESATDMWQIGDAAELVLEDGTCEPGWRSRGFGSKEISSVIVVRRKTTLPTVFHVQLKLWIN